MADTDPGSTGAQDTVLVRYWASARSAAGRAAESFPAPATLADLLAAVVARHRDRPRLADVVGVCAVLVGDRPVGTSDPADVVLRGGETVELIHPGLNHADDATVVLFPEQRVVFATEFLADALVTNNPRSLPSTCSAFDRNPLSAWSRYMRVAPGPRATVASPRISTASPAH